MGAVGVGCVGVWEWLGVGEGVGVGLGVGLAGADEVGLELDALGDGVGFSERPAKAQMAPAARPTRAATTMPPIIQPMIGRLSRAP